MKSLRRSRINKYIKYKYSIGGLQCYVSLALLVPVLRDLLLKFRFIKQ